MDATTKIYFAGPDVFFPNAMEIARQHKYICFLHGAECLFPLDNEVDTSLPKEEQAKQIVQGNMKMIQNCDYIFANLSNFRGTIDHPYCDSGTAWECGYGIGLGKTVIGYTHTAGSIPTIIRDNIHLCMKLSANSNAMEIFDLVSKIDVRNITLDFLPDIPAHFTMNAPYFQIQDANSENAFLAGLATALGKKYTVSVSDSRPQVEKYGVADEHGFSVEDFCYPINIMIAVNAEKITES